MRALANSGLGLVLLLAACQRPELKDTAVVADEVVNIGVDIDVNWDLTEADRYQLMAVVTLSTVEVTENPGGVIEEEIPLDDCSLHVMDPDTSHHDPYTDAPGLDAGPTVTVTLGDTRVELPAVDDDGSRYYVLATDSVSVPLTFPAAVGVELSGDGEDGLPATTVADAGWLPAPFGWTGPTDLAAGDRPELDGAADLPLTWDAATPGAEGAFTVWVNNMGTDSEAGAFWEQLKCPVTDDGVYTVAGANEGAMHVGDVDTLRTVQLERYASAPAAPLSDGFQGSFFASQVRRADFVPVAE